MATFLFFLAVIGSMISQLPAILEAEVDVYFKILWVLPLSYLLAARTRSFFDRPLRFLYGFVALFALYCLTIQSFSKYEYLGPDLYNMAVCLMVCAVSYVYWKGYGSFAKLKWLVTVLMVLAVILAVTIYVDSLQSVSMSTMQYAYNAKNSAGQILLNVMVLAITCYIPRLKLSRLAWFTALLILTVIIFMLKSRATLCGFFFIVFYYAFCRGSFKYKVISSLVILASVLFVLLNDAAYKLVVEQILFANRYNFGASLDDLSSGRVELLAIQVAKIPGHWLFGSGIDYADCFPLMMVVQYGVVGATIVFAFIWKICVIINRMKPRSGIYLATYLLFWASLINALFEAYPPFGPGVKCFIIWLALGFAMVQQQKRLLNKTNPIIHG